MHDVNGTELKKGDRVLVLCEITDLSTGEDYCNVSLKTIYGRRPDGNKETMNAINTGVLIKFSGPTS